MTPIQRFFARPAAWKAVVLLVVYLAIYLGLGRLIGVFFGGLVSANPLDTPASIFFGVVLAIVLGGIVLALLTVHLGWWPVVFGRQPVPGRGWMWIAPALVLATVVSHLVSVRWSAWSAGQLAMLVLVGIAVGFTEELATRGLTVTILRKAGHGELMVAIVSSVLFAGMHLVNLITGMPLQTVLATLVYTIAFGACMYLTMRVTGTIWAAMVLHGLTDPTTMLSAGGVDAAGAAAASGSNLVTTVLTVVLVLFGLIALFFVRGRAQPADAETTPSDNV